MSDWIYSLDSQNTKFQLKPCNHRRPNIHLRFEASIKYFSKQLSTTFTDTEVNNCFSIYLTSWITSGPKSNFICENIATKAILFFFGCSEVNSTWLITSELANQRARKVLFTCVVYTNDLYTLIEWDVTDCQLSLAIFLRTLLPSFLLTSQSTLGTVPAW